jgi:hypothetical protein
MCIRRPRNFYNTRHFQVLPWTSVQIGKEAGLRAGHLPLLQHWRQSFGSEEDTSTKAAQAALPELEVQAEACTKKCRDQRPGGIQAVLDTWTEAAQVALLELVLQAKARTKKCYGQRPAQTDLD